MSFILDALKKSEHARQSQAGPSLADVQLHRPPGERPWWAMLIAALLAVNVLVLILVLTRKPADPPPAAIATPAAPAAPAPQEPVQAAPRREIPAATGGPQVSLRTLAGQPQSAIAPEDTVAIAPQSAPAAALPQAAPAPANAAQVFTPAPAAAPTPAAPRPAGEVLPSADELLASGTRLPELHLDIHVHADDASQRFVFINMRKYAEGETLSEGPRLERITPDGAILNQHGLRFLLPRQ